MCLNFSIICVNANTLIAVSVAESLSFRSASGSLFTLSEASLKHLTEIMNVLMSFEISLSYSWCSLNLC